MRIATYNVNSIRARAERILAWTRAARPEILCMQELKAEDQDFPLGAFEDLGYNVATWGQKTYNGVALLSQSPLDDVRRGLAGTRGEDGEQARLISAWTGGVRVHCVYAPNGEAPGTEKFAYKLGWMQRFAELVAKDVAGGESVAVCGDFNVAPADVDVYDPDKLRETIHVSTPEREALARIVDVGLVDSFRRVHPKERAFTFWDYRMLAFPKNRGYRIDHILVTPDLAERLVGATIDREARKGEKPSDHAPLVVEFNDVKGSE